MSDLPTDMDLFDAPPAAPVAAPLLWPGDDVFLRTPS
jgi:hypothetical protein